MVAVIAGLWWEVRNLRQSRHRHDNLLTLHAAQLSHVSAAVDDLRATVAGIRDYMLRHGASFGERS